MNQLFISLGLATWKPTLVALLLPPVPWLVLMLVGARGLWRRRAWGWWLTLPGAFALWASCTTFVAEHLGRWLLDPPPALSDAARAALRGPAAQAQKTTIVVLGGGRDPKPEYYRTSLSDVALERLRYGVWLARDTGLPLAFSGGLAPGFDGPTEADIATRIAADEFRRPLQWSEGESRDTRENAALTLKLLRERGIAHIVLVTHEAHMPRALRDFARAGAAAGWAPTVTAAPIGTRDARLPWVAGDFLPGNHGWFKTRYVLREWLGIVAGA